MFEGAFYFLRHGQTEANARGLISGALDVELTTLGREQARTAARALAFEPITAIYSSPLCRARETAEAVARVLRLPVNIVPELIERRRGQLEGKAFLYAEDTMSHGDETFEDFTVRVLEGLSRVKSSVPLLVAHLGVLRVLCRTLDIRHAEGPLANAIPLRFEPLPESGWKFEALSIGERQTPL